MSPLVRKNLPFSWLCKSSSGPSEPRPAVSAMRKGLPRAAAPWSHVKSPQSCQMSGSMVAPRSMRFQSLQGPKSLETLQEIEHITRRAPSDIVLKMFSKPFQVARKSGEAQGPAGGGGSGQKSCFGLSLRTLSRQPVSSPQSSIPTPPSRLSASLSSQRPEPNYL